MIVGLIAALLILSGCRNSPNTPLTIAANNGNTAEVQRLVMQHVDVNERDNNGYTALMWAARNGHTEVMKSLLDAGADMNLRDCATNGWTALIHAIHKNENKAASLLIDQGADVNARAGGCQEVAAEGGMTPLMFAAVYDNTEIVRALLAKGADPYAESNGTNALSYAVAGGAFGAAVDIDRASTNTCSVTTVKALLEKAPDLKMQNGLYNRTALFLTKHKGCSEVVNLIEGRQQNSHKVANVK